MSDHYKKEVSRALFYISLAREKLNGIKASVKRDAIGSPDGEGTPEEVAAALERAVYADTIFKSVLGLDLMESALEIAAKVHGSLAVQTVGPFISLRIKDGVDLTVDELAFVMPRAHVTPTDLLIGLSDEEDACQCEECAAGRAGRA
jgi:hypothetical protein